MKFSQFYDCIDTLLLFSQGKSFLNVQSKQEKYSSGSKYVMGDEYLWEESCCFKKVKGREFNGNPFFLLFFILLMRYHNEVFILNDWHINPL